MSRRRIGVLLPVLAAGLLGAGTGSTSTGSTSTGSTSTGSTTPVQERPQARPTVLVGPLYPLSVRGIRFRAFERVTVTLDGGRGGAVRVVADRAGAFRTSFRVRVPPCRTVTIRAVGSRGSRVVRQLPRPNCREP